MGSDEHLFIFDSYLNLVFSGMVVSTGALSLRVVNNCALQRQHVQLG